jgi:hypothetical protein
MLRAMSLTNTKKAMTDESKQKWQAIIADWQLTIKTYSTMAALHTLAQHWVENELIIERAATEEAEINGPKWTPDYDDRDSVGEFHSERDMARYMHDTILIPMHRHSCIVMLYATVERELRRLIENLEKEGGSQKVKVNDIKANSYMAKVGKFVKDFYGVQFADCPQYASLCDLQKIRDCIIHCHGEVSLSRDKDFLVKLKDKRRGFFAHTNYGIHIDSQCIEKFVMETWCFFTWVFKSLNWKIAAHWQGDKLEQTFEKLKK